MTPPVPPLAASSRPTALWALYEFAEQGSLFCEPLRRRSAPCERPAAAPIAGPEAVTPFLVHRSSSVWRHGAPSLPAGDVADRINGFRPNQIDARVWLEIEPVAKAWVKAVRVDDAGRAGRMMTILSQLLAWSFIGGLDLRPELVLHVETIEQFVVEGLAGLSSGTRSTYRSELRAIGEVVLGPLSCPARQTLINQSNPERPYTDDEFSDLLAAVRGLTTPHRRENGIVVFALAGGGGCGSADIGGAVGTDVETDSSPLAINISFGPRPRRVIIHAEWEDEVRRRALEVGDHPMFHPGRTKVRAADIPNFLDRLNFGRLPRLTTQRLRITWIVRQLTAGVPVHVVAAAAGVGESQISRYFRFLPPVDPREADRLLRGQPR